MKILLDLKLASNEVILFTPEQLHFTDRKEVHHLMAPNVFQPRLEGLRKIRHSLAPMLTDPLSPKSFQHEDYDETKSVKSATRSLSIRFTNPKKEEPKKIMSFKEHFEKKISQRNGQSKAGTVNDKVPAPNALEMFIVSHEPSNDSFRLIKQRRNASSQGPTARSYRQRRSQRCKHAPHLTYHQGSQLASGPPVALNNTIQRGSHAFREKPDSRRPEAASTGRRRLQDI
jgi:hypothetical protein